MIKLKIFSGAPGHLLSGSNCQNPGTSQKKSSKIGGIIWCFMYTCWLITCSAGVLETALKKKLFPHFFGIFFGEGPGFWQLDLGCLGAPHNIFSLIEVVEHPSTWAYIFPPWAWIKFSVVPFLDLKPSSLNAGQGSHRFFCATHGTSDTIWRTWGRWTPRSRTGRTSSWWPRTLSNTCVAQKD